MASKAQTALRQQLPGLAAHHLAAVPDDAAADLAALLAESRAAQHGALDAAIEKGMRHVPLLLRGPLKKILFP